VESETDHRILLLTNQGNCYSLNAIEIPEAKWRDKGVQLASIIKGFERTEKIVALLSIKEFSQDSYIQFYTSQGMIKKTSLAEYDTNRTKIQACGLKDNDEVIGAELISEDKEIMIITANGMSIRFNGNEVNPMGRAARGVKAIQLKGDDRVIFGSQIDEDGDIVVVTDQGIAKRTPIAEYQCQGRGGIGFKTLTFYKNNANGRYILGAFYVQNPFEIIMQQRDGTITRINTNDLPIAPRDGRGSTVIKIEDANNGVEHVYRNYNE